MPLSKPGFCFIPQQRHLHWGLRVDHCWETTSVATRPKRRIRFASKNRESFPQLVATPRFHIVDLQGQPLSRAAWLQCDENLGWWRLVLLFPPGRFLVLVGPTCGTIALGTSWNHGCSADLKMATVHPDTGVQISFIASGFKFSWIWTCPCRHPFQCKSKRSIYSGDSPNKVRNTEILVPNMNRYTTKPRPTTLTTDKLPAVTASGRGRWIWIPWRC